MDVKFPYESFVGIEAGLNKGINILKIHNLAPTKGLELGDCAKT